MPPRVIRVDSSRQATVTFYIARVTDFISMHSHQAYAAVFFLAFSEAIPILGTVIPGSTFIVAISALVTRLDLNPWLLLVAATIGAVAGDGLSFSLGRRFHLKTFERWPLDHLTRVISRSEAFFNKYGGASVFLARFTPPVRAFVPLIAGILRMSPRQFYVANVLSAVVWAPAHVFPGIALGIIIGLTGATTAQILVLIVATMLGAWSTFRVIRLCLDRSILRRQRKPGGD
jgi:membrane protein DedA with SNARE-associated domain